ncbi:MAG: hypothetical protein Alis3KO_38730 [Aliiglaciecola sp.]
MTLGKRLNAFFVGYSICTFAMCCLLTIVSLYAIEDGFFDRKLKTAALEIENEQINLDNGQMLKFNIVYYTEQRNLPFAGANFQTNEITEISHNDRYFHVLPLNRSADTQSFLVYDVTDELLVTNSLDDLSSLFAALFVVMMVCTLFFTRFFSQIILRPFQKLVEVVNTSAGYTEVQQLGETIREKDIKSLFLSIAENLQQREHMLNDQITFNQGISHELSTPIQVAKHATELIKSNDDVSSRALERLKQALNKMEKTSSAFLWLSSNNTWHVSVEVTNILEDIISASRDLVQKQKLIVMTDIEQTCYLIAPREVIGVVLENLLRNAINHCTDNEISVKSDCTGVTFTNRFNTQSQSEGFGIGILLVNQLAKRFNFVVNYTQADGLYCARIITNANIDNEQRV